MRKIQAPCLDQPNGLTTGQRELLGRIDQRMALQCNDCLTESETNAIFYHLVDRSISVSANVISLHVPFYHQLRHRRCVWRQPSCLPGNSLGTTRWEGRRIRFILPSSNSETACPESAVGAIFFVGKCPANYQCWGQLNLDVAGLRLRVLLVSRQQIQDSMSPLCNGSMKTAHCAAFKQMAALMRDPSHEKSGCRVHMVVCTTHHYAFGLEWWADFHSDNNHSSLKQRGIPNASIRLSRRMNTTHLNPQEKQNFFLLPKLIVDLAPSQITLEPIPNSHRNYDQRGSDGTRARRMSSLETDNRRMLASQVRRALTVAKTNTLRICHRNHSNSLERIFLQSLTSESNECVDLPQHLNRIIVDTPCANLLDLVQCNPHIHTLDFRPSLSQFTPDWQPRIQIGYPAPDDNNGDDPWRAHFSQRWAHRIVEQVLVNKQRYQMSELPDMESSKYLLPNILQQVVGTKLPCILPPDAQFRISLALVFVWLTEHTHCLI